MCRLMYLPGHLPAHRIRTGAAMLKITSAAVNFFFIIIINYSL